MNRISHWIDGKVVEGSSGRSGIVFDGRCYDDEARFLSDKPLLRFFHGFIHRSLRVSERTGSETGP